LSLRAARSRGHRNHFQTEALAGEAKRSLRAARSRGHRNDRYPSILYVLSVVYASGRYEQPDQEGIETLRCECLRRCRRCRYEQPDQEGIETDLIIGGVTAPGSLRAARSRGHRNLCSNARHAGPGTSLRAVRSSPGQQRINHREVVNQARPAARSVDRQRRPTKRLKEFTDPLQFVRGVKRTLLGQARSTRSGSPREPRDTRRLIHDPGHDRHRSSSG